MRRLMATGAAAVVGAVLFMGAPAFGATGYPPPTLPGTPGSPTVTITCTEGSTCTLTFTGFFPGSTVTITFDGQFAATVTVTLDGSFTITTAVTDPHVSVDGGSLDVAAFGSNAVTASGTGANNQALTVTDTEIIPAVATSTVTGGSTGATGSSGTGSSGTSSSSSGSSLAFTGAQIGMMAGGGLLLLVAGTGIVLATRQRRSRTI